MKRQHRRNFYYTIAALAVVVGILGSLSAWESGTISLVQLLLQAGASMLLADWAVRRAKLRRHRHPPVHSHQPVPVGRVA